MLGYLLLGLAGYTIYQNTKRGSEGMKSDSQKESFSKAN